MNQGSGTAGCVAPAVPTKPSQITRSDAETQLGVNSTVGFSVHTALSHAEERTPSTAGAVHISQPMGSSAQDSFPGGGPRLPSRPTQAGGAPSKSFPMPNGPTRLIAKWSAAKWVRGNLQALLGHGRCSTVPPSSIPVACTGMSCTPCPHAPAACTPCSTARSRGTLLKARF